MALITSPFLSEAEMSSPNDYFDKGVQTGGSLSDDWDKSNARTANNQKVSDYKKIATAEMNTLSSNMNGSGKPATTNQPAPDAQLPVQQAPVQQQQTGAPAAPDQAPPVQQAATVQAQPVVQPQAAPAATAPAQPAPMYAGPGSPGAGASTDAPTTDVPPAAPAQPQPQATTQPAPQQPAPAAGQPGSAPGAGTPGPASMVQTLRSTPVIGNQINTMADPVYDGRVKQVLAMQQAGQISAESAKTYIDGITAARDSRLKAAVDLQKDVSAINASDATTAEKRVAVAATVRKQQDNGYNEVYQLLKSGDPEAAQLHARELGLNIDFGKTGDLNLLEQRAKRSGDYQDVAKAQDESNKTQAMAAKDWADANGTKLKSVEGVPGVFTTERNPQPFTMAQGPNGTMYQKMLTGDQVQAMGVNQKRAGAPQTNVNLQQESAFASGVGKNDATTLEQLSAQQKSSRANFRTYKSISDIANDNPKMVAGPTGALQVFAKRVLGDGGDPAVLAKTLTDQASSALELSTAQGNKGQGAFSDSERGIMRRASAGDTSNFTVPEWKTFSKAMMKAEQQKQTDINSNIDNIQSRNPKTAVGSYKMPVMTSGIPEVDNAATPAQAAGVVRTPGQRMDLDKKYGAY